MPNSWQCTLLQEQLYDEGKQAQADGIDPADYHSNGSVKVIPRKTLLMGETLDVPAKKIEGQAT